MYVDAGLIIPLADVDDVVHAQRGLKDLGLRPVFPRRQYRLRCRALVTA